MQWCRGRGHRACTRMGSASETMAAERQTVRPGRTGGGEGSVAAGSMARRRNVLRSLVCLLGWRQGLCEGGLCSDRLWALPPAQRRIHREAGAAAASAFMTQGPFQGLAMCLPAQGFREMCKRKVFCLFLCLFLFKRASPCELQAHSSLDLSLLWLGGALCPRLVPRCCMSSERSHPTQWTWLSVGALPAEAGPEKHLTEPVLGQAQLTAPAYCVNKRLGKAPQPSNLLIRKVGIIPTQRACGKV